MQLCCEAVAIHTERLRDALTPMVETARMRREDLASLQAECSPLLAGRDLSPEACSTELVINQHV